MRAIPFVILTATLASGCMLGDENPDWAPQADYPPWMYDAPFYHTPAEDLPVLETLNGIPIYHSRNEYFFVRHPAGYQVIGEPRVGVWYSNNQGHEWERAGFYGVEQAHFLFQAQGDGQYWIRFVGPGQGTSTVPPGMPHRIYIVDRQPPRIVLMVQPSPWQDEEKKIPRRFKVGQDVALRWLVRDRRLDMNSPKLELCFARFPYNKPWLTVPEKIGQSGSCTIVIPKKAAEDGGLRFRLVARDLAGNMGVAVTDVLHIVSKRPPTLVPRIKPVKPDDVVRQTEGTPGKRLGWPRAGAMLRGGATRVLAWLPETAKKYGSLKLDFSFNNGQTWETVARNLKPDQLNRWTVPRVNSKNCKLRIVGVDAQGQRYMLIASSRFTTTTVVRDDTVGPTFIPPYKEGIEAERPGWPQAGTRMLGRTARSLVWLPELASKYSSIGLDFSADNGQTWQNVAKNLKAGEHNRWVVPDVDGSSCRLRIVGVDAQGKKFMLIMGPQFVVTKLPRADTLGPKLIPAPE